MEGLEYGKRRGDHIGDGTEKKLLWSVGWVWGGQAGLGLAADRCPCVSTREGLRAPRIPISQQRPGSGTRAAPAPFGPRCSHACAGSPRLPPRRASPPASDEHSGRSVQRAVRPLGGSIQSAHPAVFSLSRDSPRGVTRPAPSPPVPGGWRRPPARPVLLLPQRPRSRETAAPPPPGLWAAPGSRESARRCPGS